jgi:hypothetical protein
VQLTCFSRRNYMSTESEPCPLSFAPEPELSMPIRSLDKLCTLSYQQAPAQDPSEFRKQQSLVVLQDDPR